MATFGNDLLPDSTGRKLGAEDARWDASIRNLDVTGLITGPFAALASFSVGMETVPWSASPVFDGTHSTGFKITLTGATPSPAINNVAAGDFALFVIIQDNAGQHPWTWPGNVRGGMAIGMAPGEASVQLFWSDGTTLWGMPGQIV
jgi:hypothetical protein